LSTAPLNSVFAAGVSLTGQLTDEVQTPPGCDPQDPACGGAPPGCDPQDPACSDNNGGNGAGDSGGAPPPPPGCDPQDPACSDNNGGNGGGPPPPCNFLDPDCGGAPPPCQPGTPGCDVNPCDPLDPQCVDNPPTHNGNSGPPSNVPPFSCRGGLTNVGNGVVDNRPKCVANRNGPGGPANPLVPGGLAGTPQSGSPIGDPNILGISFPKDLFPSSAAAIGSDENICNDGIDNNHNSLTDTEDPTCIVPELTLASSNSPGDNDLTKLNIGGVGNHTIGLIKLSNSQNSLVVSGGSNKVNTNSDNMIITITGGETHQTHDIRTISQHYKYSPAKITVSPGAKVTWVNDDSSQTHGITLMDKVSGKIIFSYPVLRSGNLAYYIFENPGQYVYVDTKYATMTGLINVVG
jgi:plastocyanin